MQKTLDRVAVSLSVVCAIHCAVLPLIVAVVPSLLSSMADDATFHWLMLWFVLPTSAVATFMGCRRHGYLPVALLIALGAGMVAVAATVGHEAFGHTLERVVTILGGFILSVGHLLNQRLCKHGCHTHD